ncbi:MAG: hypothetical protein HY875_17465 [Chloroflexi bacterium]|nr:hypothetical protein [Chloroflexota bacterium]
MTIGTRWLRAAPAALTAAAALLLLVWGLAGGGESARAANASVNVGQGGNFFSPTDVTIGNGEKVTWTWVGGTHTVTADSGSPFPSTAINLGNQTFEWTATVTDTKIAYHCSIHPNSMKGTITIGTPPPTPTNTPVPPTNTPTSSPTSATGTPSNTPTNTPTHTPTTSPTATVPSSPTPPGPRHKVVAPEAAKN